MIKLEARTTSVNRGRRVHTVRRYDRVSQIELDFIPGDGDRPTQARIWHKVWIRGLRRYDTHVDLVVQDDLPADLASLDVEVVGLPVALTCTGCDRVLVASPDDEALIAMEGWYEDPEDRTWCTGCAGDEAVDL